jgi:RNA polymerase sigma factor (TIGR02999 family)
MTPTLDAPITSATDATDAGRPSSDTLFVTLYDDLHRLARREVMRRRLPDLGVTTLLHEAYIAISARKSAVFPHPSRFMAYAAQVIRGVSIDNLRARHARKRGAGVHHTTFVGDLHGVNAPDLPAQINEALEELAAHDAALAEVIDLKFFQGLSFGEIAAMKGVSERTIKRQWRRGRLYLHNALSEGDASV